jgi:hypothetical protein
MEKCIGKIICIMYVYLLIHHSVCLILCRLHADHILPKFPTLHRKLSGPAIGFVALWSTFICLLSYHILILYHIPSYFLNLKLISFLYYHCSWTAWPLNVTTRHSFRTVGNTCPVHESTFQKTWIISDITLRTSNHVPLISFMFCLCLH